jgi:hypothetical protein
MASGAPPGGGGSSNLGDAVVDVRLRLDKLEADLKKGLAATDRTANRMEASFVKLRRAVTRVAGPLVALVSIQGFARLTRQTLDWARGLRDAAVNLGLTVEQLQILEIAAFRANANFGQAQVAVQRLGRRLAEALRGTGEARDALQEMGILGRIASGELEGIGDVLDAVFEQLGDMQNVTERNRLEFKLFDSEGVRIVNNLIPGWKQLNEELRQSGLILSDETIDALSAADVAFREMTIRAKQSFRGLVADVVTGWIRVKNAIGETLTPVEFRALRQSILSELIPLQERINELLGQGIQPDLSPFGDALAQELAFALRRADNLSGRLRELSDQMRALGV